MKVRSAIVIILSVFALLACTAGWGREILVTSGDNLLIKVEGEPGMSKYYPVDDQGMVNLPEVGNFKVAGQTLTQLKESLTKAISVYVKDPQVTVEMPSSSQSREMLVYGEVKRPGSTPIKDDYRLMDVLNAVGGLTDNADRIKAVLVKKDTTTSIPLDLEGLLKGDISKNMPVSPGDTLFVPAKTQGTLMITGHVQSPGERIAKTGMTLMEAIISAGGFASTADQSHVKITRKDQAPVIIDMQEEPTAGGVPMWQAFTVLSGDQIFVPENKEAYFNILGGVKTPGQHPIKKKLYITDAITMAGGFVDRARKDRVQLARAASDGKPAKAITINMNRLFKGDISQNVEIMPGDTISIDVGREKRSAGDIFFKDVLPVVSTIFYWGVLR